MVSVAIDKGASDAPPLAVRPRQAARLIGIGVTSFYELINAKEIPIVKFGSRTLVRTSDLEAWLNRQLEKSRTEGTR